MADGMIDHGTKCNGQPCTCLDVKHDVNIQSINALHGCGCTESEVMRGCKIHDWRAAGCTWQGDPDQRTIAHILECPACTRAWPLVADYFSRPNPHCGCTALGACRYHGGPVEYTRP